MKTSLVYALSGRVGVLEINREDRHNALGADELEALDATLALVREDKNIRVLIVTGRGDKTFCAGAALEDLESGRLSPARFQAAMQQLADLPVPTIARVNGSVFGGGVELALSCDFRVGVRGLRLRVPAAALGLCYPAQGIGRFVAKLGANTARRMLVAAETFAADELLRVGFFDYLVDADALDERTDELSQRLAALAPLAVRAMKELIIRVERQEANSGRAEELSRICHNSADLQEGLAARREKRAPRFVGA